MNKLIISVLLLATSASPAVAAKLISASSPAAATSSTKTPAPTVTTAAPIVAAEPAPTQIPARSIIAAVSEPSQSSGAKSQPRVVTQSSGLYTGAQLGDSTVGFLLGYQINKIYAFEANLDYVDAVYTPTTSLEVYRAGLSGLAYFPVKFNDLGAMSLFVKVGYVLTSSKFILKDPGIPGFAPPSSTATTTDITKVAAGAGVQLDLSSNTSARLGINLVGEDRSVYITGLYRF
jgi:opacity protein-like surface antigen